MKEAPPLWKIVLGVATGALLAGLIGWVVRLWLVGQAIQSVTETTARASQQILENSQRQMQAIKDGIRFLETSPFACRKAGTSPFLRELIIPFGRTGYVALCEIVGSDHVIVGAVRHQREDDYH